jgi:hypothetical protein
MSHLFVGREPPVLHNQLEVPGFETCHETEIIFKCGSIMLWDDIACKLTRDDFPFISHSF